MSLRLRSCDVLVTTVFTALVYVGAASAQKMPGASHGPSVAPTFMLGNADDYADRPLSLLPQGGIQGI